jgi:succinoglycan biosynthesis protein ExoO
VFTAAREIDLETWVRHNQPMQAGDCLGYLKPLFRRSMLIETGQRYDEDMRNSEDYYLVAHLLAGGARMTYTPESGYRYTRSPASTSHRLSPAHTQAWLAAEQGFLARRGDKLTAGERQAQSARMRRLRDVHQFVGSVDAISKKNPAGFARALAADPTAWSFTLSWFAKIAWSKVAGRKAA